MQYKHFRGTSWAIINTNPVISTKWCRPYCAKPIEPVFADFPLSSWKKPAEIEQLVNGGYSFGSIETSSAHLPKCVFFLTRIPPDVVNPTAGLILNVLLDRASLMDSV